MSALSPIAALLGGGGGPPGPGPGGPPHLMFGGPPQQPPQQQGPEGQSVPANLKAALDALHAAFGAENDPQDKSLIGKAMLIVQQIFEQEQKDKDAAMSGTQNPRLMRRSRP